MTLDKAIQTLDDLLTDGPYWPEEQRREAVKLGIEALKECLKAREGDPALDGELLPGETE